MLQYLIILLDNTSVSFCYYENNKQENKLISLDILKKGILFARKRNLKIHFVYPVYEIPEEYKRVIEEVEHYNITPSSLKDIKSEVIVFENWADLASVSCFANQSLVLRLKKDFFFKTYEKIQDFISKIDRISILIIDVDCFNEEDFLTYKNVLKTIKGWVKKEYERDHYIQINILTDRLMLESMNNCNAGNESITLAANGKFYICPAFYYENEKEEIGNPEDGLQINNKQIYSLQYAPLCRICDAYQCRRCVWLNKKTTDELNVPSREQCMSAHLERNVSKELLEEMKEKNLFPVEKDIINIDYLDPFQLKINKS